MRAIWPFSKRSQEAKSSDDEVLPCSQCLRCVAACPTGALSYQDRTWRVDLSACIFCRSCAQICPNLLIGGRET